MWDYIKNNPVKVIIALTVLALTFIIFGHHYREEVQLAMKTEFITLPKTTVDWWSVSHAVLFFLFGLIMPGYPLTFIVMGAGFEAVEDYLSSDATTQLADCPAIKKAKKESFWCNGLNDDYWYAKWDDIIWDGLGYVCGQALRQTWL